MNISSSRSSTKPVPSATATRKGYKPKVKSPLSTEDRLQRLFTSLCAQIDGGHFRNAVKTCDTILCLDPSDKDARKAKIFLLLQSEMYAEALNLLDAEDSKETYERAYTLYRSQRENEARDILEVIKKGEDDRGTLHLEAQLNYREGLYQEAFDLYNQLLDTAEPNSEEYSDILTNLQASQSHLDFINTGSRHAVAALPLSISSTLETSPPPAQQTSMTASARLTSAVDDHENPKPATKKVRMRRVPTGVIPGVSPPPDPERWLKKSERSTFNQGRRKKGAGGASQGVAVEPTHIQAGAIQSSKAVGKGKKKK